MDIRKPSSTSARITLSAILAAVALIFSYIEAMIPINPGIPGIKLGIANLVIIISLYILDFKYTMFINLIRIIVSGLLFTGVFGALYSLSGGLLSLFLMYGLQKTKLFSIVGISMAGGVAHNLGQLLVAALLVSNIKIFVYFPVLLFSGLISGILIGIIAFLILRRLPKSTTDLSS